MLIPQNTFYFIIVSIFWIILIVQRAEKTLSWLPCKADSLYINVNLTKRRMVRGSRSRNYWKGGCDDGRGTFFCSDRQRRKRKWSQIVAWEVQTEHGKKFFTDRVLRIHYLERLWYLHPWRFSRLRQNHSQPNVVPMIVLLWAEWATYPPEVLCSSCRFICLEMLSSLPVHLLQLRMYCTVIIIARWMSQITKPSRT